MNGSTAFSEKKKKKKWYRPNGGSNADHCQNLGRILLWKILPILLGVAKRVIGGFALGGGGDRWLSLANYGRFFLSPFNGF